MTAIAKRGRPRTWNCSPQTVLSRTGEERELVALTLPRLSILHVTGGDLKEAATRFAEYRILRAGRDAWQAINKAESFDGWKAIGKALAIGRDHALRSTGANAPHGRRYSLAFSAWAKEHGFGEMQKGVRSIALELHANIEAITEWRAALPEKQRKRLIHPLSNVRRWRAATPHNGGKSPVELKREAKAAWKRFTWCLRSLPAHEAAPLWEMAYAEVAGCKVNV